MFTLSGSGMDLNAVERATTPPTLSGSGHRGRPTGFSTHRDAQGRFELHYPQAWELVTGDAVQVRSKSTGAFARVEVCSTLQEALARIGGELTLRREHDGWLRGSMERDGMPFDVLAGVHPRGTDTIVLITGMPATASSLQSYAVQVLAAIRREFRVL